MRILHVIEGLASGVLSAVELLSAEQSRCGGEVTVLYTRSTDTPPPSELARAFTDAVTRIELNVPRGMPAGLRLAQGLNGLNLDGYDVVHAHSSWAGLVVRGAALKRRPSSRIWYTPHAYGFLMTDTSAVTRRAVVATERLLSKVGSVAAVSQSEAKLASEVARSPRVRVLSNRIQLESLPKRCAEAASRTKRRPRVVSLGRVATQKNPQRFGVLASMLGDTADFVWVGATETDAATVFANTPVKTVPWRSKEQALLELADSDIYLSTSRWEGLPLAVLEAQAIGLPVVCTAVSGNTDAVRHGHSGFVCETNDQLAGAIERLLADPQIYLRASAAGKRWVAENFSVDSLGPESLAMYMSVIES